MWSIDAIATSYPVLLVLASLLRPVTRMDKSDFCVQFQQAVAYESFLFN